MELFKKEIKSILKMTLIKNESDDFRHTMKIEGADDLEITEKLINLQVL